MNMGRWRGVTCASSMRNGCAALPPANESFVGSADIQSLADLGNSYEVVRSMRMAPISNLAVLGVVAATLLPIAPLLLTVMPLEELLREAVFHPVLARISHQVLSKAKPMSSREAPMRARKAKPRPYRGREADNRVSTGHCGLGSASTRISPCPGAVLPKPGFPIHPPDGEKSRLESLKPQTCCDQVKFGLHPYPSGFARILRSEARERRAGKRKGGS